MRRLISVILLIFLSGCDHPAPTGKNHPPRVITAIEVTASAEGQLTHYRYTSEEKMQAVMHYLRHIQPQLSTTISPDTFRTNAFRITLLLSDGTQTIYHQIHSDYLQKNDGVWHSIDSSKGAALLRLLEELPSDA